MNSNDQRDNELDAMLNSLRQENPDEHMIKRWQSAIPANSRFARRNAILRRGLEWGIAAAIGFAAAALLFHKPMSSLNDGDQNRFFVDVDATEMRFIAK